MDDRGFFWCRSRCQARFQTARVVRFVVRAIPSNLLGRRTAAPLPAPSRLMVGEKTKGDLRVLLIHD
jgi:hypothetical protein